MDRGALQSELRELLAAHIDAFTQPKSRSCGRDYGGPSRLAASSLDSEPKRIVVPGGHEAKSGCPPAPLSIRELSAVPKPACSQGFESVTRLRGGGQGG